MTVNVFWKHTAVNDLDADAFCLFEDELELVEAWAAAGLNVGLYAVTHHFQHKTETRYYTDKLTGAALCVLYGVGNGYQGGA